LILQCCRHSWIFSCKTSRNPRITSLISGRLRRRHSRDAWPPAVALIPDDQSFKSSRRSLAQPSSASFGADKQELMRASQLTVDARMWSDSIETRVRTCFIWNGPFSARLDLLVSIANVRKHEEHQLSAALVEVEWAR
jgi:hypothetical protein